MVPGSTRFTFNLVQQYKTHTIASISIGPEYVNAVYQHALIAQKESSETYGFTKGTTPLYYIEQNFRPHLLEHVKEFFFTHCVMGFLCQSLYEHKLVIAGDPILTNIEINHDQQAHFTFILAHAPPEREERWKKLSLRPPERKYYKDLDRQVETFIKEETDKTHSASHEAITMGDWVCFEMYVVNSTHEPILPHYKDQLWVKISDEEADLELHKLFLGKKIGDIFYSQSPFLQDYITNKLTTPYTFGICIKDYLPHIYFSFEHFKRHFSLRSAKDMHHKLIEVFSYRNDMSQRRETVEATLKLLLKHFVLFLPKHLVERQRQMVLSSVHLNPDYHVYKAQNDFKDKIRLLAEKQLKEAIVIDTIAYQEQMAVCHDDIISYLNLIKRPRTKEFVYFDLPVTKSGGHEIPVSTQVLKQYCLREKTLNHVIQYITKRG